MSLLIVAGAGATTMSKFVIERWERKRSVRCEETFSWSLGSEEE